MAYATSAIDPNQGLGDLPSDLSSIPTWVWPVVLGVGALAMVGAQTTGRAAAGHARKLHGKARKVGRQAQESAEAGFSSLKLIALGGAAVYAWFFIQGQANS